MGFFAIDVPAPFPLPEGTRATGSAYTGTACLALIDTAVAGDVWEDLLYDGHDHEHGAGGLMINSASVGTHLDHDGDFPVEQVVDESGATVGFRVNLDPYAEDLTDVRHEDHGHGHGHGHAEGWSEPVSVSLRSDRAVFGDPAGLPHADDTGDLVEMRFPAPGGTLLVSVFTDHGLRRELRATWSR